MRDSVITDLQHVILVTKVEIPSVIPQGSWESSQIYMQGNSSDICPHTLLFNITALLQGFGGYKGLHVRVSFSVSPKLRFDES